MCTAWYVSPAPSTGQIDRFYHGYLGQHHRAGSRSAADLAYEIRQSDWSSSIVMRELVSLRSLQGKKCLDVGFGRGLYLHWVRMLGGIPCGVDVDQDAIHFAESALGIRTVRQGTIFGLPETDQFDVIFLIDLIEHPLEPAAILEKAKALLQPEGLLVVWTPNASQADRETKPVLFRVDLEHMQYLTTRAMQYVSRRLGMPIVHLETCGYPELTGIETAPQVRTTDYSRLSMRNWVKSTVLRFPLAKSLRNLKLSVQDRMKKDDRLGCYHLFCIMEKTS